MPSPFFSRYIIDWLATQTMTRAQQMVVEEVKSRVESGDLGSYEGLIFKDSIKGNAPKDRITVAGVELGVVVATKQEAVGLLDKLGVPRVTKGNSFKYYFGSWKGRAIAIVQTGSGLDAARRGTEALIQAFRPARIASIGFASSVVPSLKTKALFIPERLVSEDGKTIDLSQRALTSEASPEREKTKDDLPDPLSADKEGSDSADDVPCARSEAADFSEVVSNESEADDVAPEKTSCSPVNLAVELADLFRTGTLLSLNSEKPSDEQKKGVSAYDHSTWAVAEVCAAYGVPFLPLRVVYDVKSQKVSAEAARVVKSNQSLARTMGALFGATMKKPSSVLDVYKVKEKELEAADALASAVCRILAAIVVSEKR